VLQDNADNYRSLCVPNCPTGFRRDNESFKLSESKSRLDFNVEDSQMGLNYPPPGIVLVTAAHTYQSQGQGLITYSSSLNATYEVQNGTSTSVAFNHFRALADSRRAAAKGYLQRELKIYNDQNPTAKIEGAPQILVSSFSASEVDAYGKTQCQFSQGWTVVTSLSWFLMTGALWTPIPAIVNAGENQSPTFVPGNNDWELWSAKLSALDPSGRGLAGLAFQNSNEVIIDLCSGEPQSVLKKVVNNNPTKATLTGAQGNPDIPTPTASWALYKNAVKLLTEDSTVVHNPLATGTFTNAISNGVNANTGGNGYAPVQNDPNSPSAQIYQRSGQACYVVMSGSAIRAGYEITPPQLLSIGGVACIRAFQPGDGFHQEIVANWGMPIYYGQWRFRYLVPTPPITLPTAPNPVLGQTINLSVLRGGPEVFGGGPG
jgi:hypothetical protein